MGSSLTFLNEELKVKNEKNIFQDYLPKKAVVGVKRIREQQIDGDLPTPNLRMREDSHFEDNKSIEKNGKKIPLMIPNFWFIKDEAESLGYT